MLRELSISGLAVVKELTLEFGPGLNVLTGETGAGKSIIVGAIGLLIGEKAGAEMVRTGEKTARITGVFELHRGGEALTRMEEAGIALQGNEVMVKREISSEGRTRAYVNGEPVSLAVLKKLGDLLVDFHGQHEHQSLLRKTTHVELLDSFGSLGELREKTWKDCVALRQQRQELDALLAEQRDVQAQLDFIRFQVSEIDSAELKEGEEEGLEEERAVLANFEKLASAAREASDLLYEDEPACVERLSQASRALKAAAAIDPKLESLQEELCSAQISVGEVGRSLTGYLQSLEFSPSRLDEVESRLSLISRMKKKFRRDVSEIIQLGDELRAKLSSVEEGDEKEESLRAGITREEERLKKSAALLMKKRKSAAARLERDVQKELAGLGMKGTKFVVEIELQEAETADIELEGKAVRAGPHGVGEVQFLISPNVGEDPRPLVRVASGGEVSRMMLAMKRVLIQADVVDVMVFDEIDVGIGGRVARVVGDKLKELSRAKQTICITHIPMIACLGDTQFSVWKEVEGGRTYGSARALSAGERITEVARMLAGDKVSEVTLRQAREMLDYGSGKRRKKHVASSRLKCARSSVG